jgi:hypothetical protein
MEFPPETRGVCLTLDNSVNAGRRDRPRCRGLVQRAGGEGGPAHAPGFLLWEAVGAVRGGWDGVHDVHGILV